MKKLLFLTLFFSSFAIASFAQYPSSKMSILIKGGKIKLGKKDVSKDWKLQTFTAALDTFSRKKNGTNRVHSYDNVGLALFEPAPQKVLSGLVSEFQIYLDAVEASNIVPKEFYEGKLTVEKMDITRNTPIEDLRSKLKDYKELDTGENDKYRFSKDGIYIYFLYNSSKKLGKVIVGKDKTA
jgi:hypothetical protein